MPACVVEDVHDGSAQTSASFSRESFEQRLEERFWHAIMHIAEGLAGRRRGKGSYVEPVETMKADRA